MDGHVERAVGQARGRTADGVGAGALRVPDVVIDPHHRILVSAEVGEACRRSGGVGHGVERGIEFDRAAIGIDRQTVGGPRTGRNGRPIERVGAADSQRSFIAVDIVVVGNHVGGQLAGRSDFGIIVRRCRSVVGAVDRNVDRLQRAIRGLDLKRIVEVSALLQLIDRRVGVVGGVGPLARGIDGVRTVSGGARSSNPQIAGIADIDVGVIGIARGGRTGDRSCALAVADAGFGRGAGQAGFGEHRPVFGAGDGDRHILAGRAALTVGDADRVGFGRRGSFIERLRRAVVKRIGPRAGGGVDHERAISLRRAASVSKHVADIDVACDDLARRGLRAVLDHQASLGSAGDLGRVVGPGNSDRYRLGGRPALAVSDRHHIGFGLDLILRQ